MGTELELKYRVTDERQMAEIADWQMLALLRVGQPYTLEMETTYFDTADRDFSARHWTVRKRMENGRPVFCVKTPAQDAAHPLLRGEWEVEAERAAEALPQLVSAGAPAELAGFTDEDLIPVCGARFTRSAQRLRLSKTSSCELALDRGTLFGGGREQPLLELELELKEGEERELTAFAQLLAVRFGLEREEKSKFARARSLAGR